MTLIAYDDFLKVEICVGTILSAQENNTLNKPSIILTIDIASIIEVSLL